MTTPPAPQARPPERRWRKRFLLPGILLALVALLVVWAVVRGTWADDRPRDPTSSADGVICRLYRTPEGRTVVRCAAVLDFPAEQVWATVTDYDHFAEIFPTLESSQAAPEGENRYRLSGVAITALGSWPFEIGVRHEQAFVIGVPHEQVVGKRTASWEGAKGDVTLIRGGWAVTPAGAGQTLLVYTSEVEIKGIRISSSATCSSAGNPRSSVP